MKPNNLTSDIEHSQENYATQILQWHVPLDATVISAKVGREGEASLCHLMLQWHLPEWEEKEGQAFVTWCYSDIYQSGKRRRGRPLSLDATVTSTRVGREGGAGLCHLMQQWHLLEWEEKEGQAFVTWCYSDIYQSGKRRRGRPLSLDATVTSTRVGREGGAGLCHLIIQWHLPEWGEKEKQAFAIWWYCNICKSGTRRGKPLYNMAVHV